MADSEGTRKLEAILAADVAGYSRLMQHNDEATVAALEGSRGVFREKIEANRGRVVDMAGDSVLAVFETATGAVRAATEIQAVLAERNQALSEDRRMRFRIGINLGEVIERQDGTVYGDGVNIAARLESIGEPGGVTVSGTVFDQVRNRVQLNFDFMGEQQVKNIAEPIRAYRVVAEGTPVSRKRLIALLRRRDVRRRLMSASGVLALGAVAGSWLWSQAQKRVSPVNNRIAVLPFVSMSASADDEYFADGITEELISRLSRIKGLEVIARTSIASYKGSKKKIGEIASELSVGTVLEGSVRKAGDTVRITAQLINATNEAHLWSEDYDRELRDVFTVQRDIAQHVADALGRRLGVSAAAQREAGGTSNVGAYKPYLLGRFHYNKGDVEGLHKAVQYYEEAISQDPSYAQAYAALADVHEQLAGFESDSNRFPEARTSALRALDLDQSMAEAHAALGVVRTFYEWDWVGARESFERALALNPNSAVAHNWYGWYLLFVREWDQAIAELRRAVELDPVSIIMNNDLGLGFQQAGRWNEAIDQARRTDALAPGNLWALTTLAWAQVGKADYQHALTLFQKLMDVAGRNVEALQGLASVYAFLGDAQRALQLLDEMKERSKGKPGWTYQIQVVYWALAARDNRYLTEMYRWLEKAYEERSFLLVNTSARWYDGYQSDPRWIAFRRKLGLPP